MCVAGGRERMKKPSFSYPKPASRIGQLAVNHLIPSEPHFSIWSGNALDSSEGRSLSSQTNLVLDSSST